MRRAVASPSDYQGSWYELLGLALTFVNRPKEALDAAEQAARLVPESAMVVSVQGLAHAALGDRDKAILLLQKASSMGLIAPMVSAALVRLLMDAARPEDALAVARKAREQNPDDHGLLVLTSKLLRAADKPAEAADILVKADEKGIADPELLEELGECYLALEKNEAALQVFERLLSEYPHSVTASALRGQALLQSGRLREAVEALREGPRYAWITPPGSSRCLPRHSGERANAMKRSACSSNCCNGTTRGWPGLSG